MEFNHQTQEYEPTMADFDKCIKENQALKDRWEKLKKYMLIEYDWGLEENYQDHSFAIRLILDKMQELEQE